MVRFTYQKMSQIHDMLEGILSCKTQGAIFLSRVSHNRPRLVSQEEVSRLVVDRLAEVREKRHAVSRI